MAEIIPFIPLIIAGATTGTQVGLDLAGVGQPSTPKISTTPQPLTANQNAQQTATVSQQLPTLQSLTGGSLSPEYAASFGALQSGLGNDPQATGNIQNAVNQFFGLTAPGTSGLTTSGVSGGGNPLSDLIARFTASGGGGSTLTGGGNNFQGLAG